MSDQKTHSILESIKSKLSRINGESAKKSKFDEIHKEFDSEIALNATQSIIHTDSLVNDSIENSKNSQNEDEMKNLNEGVDILSAQDEALDIEKIAAAIEAEEKAAIEATKAAKKAKDLQNEIEERQALEVKEAEEAEELAMLAIAKDSEKDAEILNNVGPVESLVQNTEEANGDLPQESLLQNTETNSADPLSISFESVISGDNSQGKPLSSIEEIEKQISDAPSLLSAEGSNTGIDPLSILEEGDFSKSDEEGESGGAGDIAEIAAKAISEASSNEKVEDEGPKARSLEDAEKALFGEEFVIQKYGLAANQKSSTQNNSATAGPEKQASEPEKLPAEASAPAAEAAKMPIEIDSKPVEVEIAEIIENSKEDKILEETVANPNFSQLSDVVDPVKSGLTDSHNVDLPPPPKDSKEIDYSEKAANSENSLPNSVSEVLPVISELKTEIDSELQKALLNIGSEDKKSSEIEDGMKPYSPSKDKILTENFSENKDQESGSQPKPLQDSALRSESNKDKAEQSINLSQTTANLSEIGDEKSIIDHDLSKIFEREDDKNSSSLEFDNRPQNHLPDSFTEESSLKKSARLVNDETLVKASFSVKKLIDAKNSIKKASQVFQDNNLSTMIASIMEPKLEKWLNENLAEIVEKVVREEVSRIVKDDNFSGK